MAVVLVLWSSYMCYSHGAFTMAIAHALWPWSMYNMIVNGPHTMIHDGIERGGPELKPMGESKRVRKASQPRKISNPTKICVTKKSAQRDAN